MKRCMFLDDYRNRIEIEVDDEGNLYFIDYDIDEDLMLVEIGEEPTAAARLAVAWSLPDRWAKYHLVLYDHKVGVPDLTPDQRVCLALSMDKEAQIQMAMEGTNVPPALRQMLLEMVGTDMDLARYALHSPAATMQQRLDIFKNLPAEARVWYARYARAPARGAFLSDPERMDILINETDDDKKIEILNFDKFVNEKRHRVYRMIKSMEYEDTILDALTIQRVLTNDQIMEIAMSIEDPDILEGIVLDVKNISPAQRTNLLAIAEKRSRGV
jgi:hypothetical protein